MILLELPDVLAVAVRVIEDEPTQSLDYSYEKQLQMLQKVRRGIADVATSRKRIELQLHGLRRECAKLRDQAEKAEAANRLERAAEARNRHAGLERQVADLSSQHTELVTEEENLTRAAQRLQVKVEQFRTRKETVKATFAAGAQKRVEQLLEQTDLDEVETTLLEMRQASEAEDLATAAATLLHGLVRRRPFPQSNRRIALLVTVQLVALNGRRLDLEPPKAVTTQLDGIMDGAPLAELANWLRARLRPWTAGHGSKPADRLTRLARLQPGEIHRGVVTDIENFGVYVDLNGVRGMVHVSELSWESVSHPSDVVDLGQEVAVQILDVDLERERVSLSLKLAQPDPRGAERGEPERGPGHPPHQAAATGRDTQEGHPRHGGHGLLGEVTAVLDENERLRAEVRRLRALLRERGIDAA